MARTAMTELQQQIEAIRREAFAAGYATAMQAVRELASRSAPGAANRTTAAPARGGNGRRRRRSRRRVTTAAKSTRTRRRTTRPSVRTVPTIARRASSGRRTTTTRRAGARPRPQRGANAQMIGEILRAAAPRAIPPADIRRALQQRGVELAFTSIRHALGQLQQRNTAQPVGKTNTWRHRGS